MNSEIENCLVILPILKNHIKKINIQSKMDFPIHATSNVTFHKNDEYGLSNPCNIKCNIP